MEQYTPYEYLKIDVCNNYGLDKLLWKQRIEWFDNNEHRLQELVDEADNRWGFIKAINAINDAKNHVPTGHIMGLDATASGPQIIACITGCYVSACQVNLVNTGKREDAYLNMCDYMNSNFGLDIDRATIKHPLMTTFYNSTSQPKKIFGDGTPSLTAFYKALEAKFEGCVEYLNDIQTLWNKDALYYKFTLPDGHVAKFKVMETVEARVEVGEIKSSFTYQTKANMAIDYGLSLQANIVQAIDGYIDREMKLRARNQGWQVLSIFDDWRASPNHMQKLRQNYVDILCEIADSNILSDILSEIAGEEIIFEKLSDDLSTYIRDAEYPLS